MTLAEWDELYDLGMIRENDLLPKNKARLDELMKKTEKEDEHPEGYDGPCFCQLCMSYGD